MSDETSLAVQNSDGVHAKVALTKTPHASVGISERVIRLLLSVVAPTRVAKADAMSALSSRLAADQLSDRELQLMEHLVGRESRRIDTLERIVAKADEALPKALVEPDATATGWIDPDWLVRFVEDSQDAVSEDLQDLYSGILARAMKAPGSVSKRTLGVVRYLDSNTAAAFGRSRSAILETGGGHLFLLPFDPPDSFYSSLSLEYADFAEMDAAGLIHTGRRELPVLASKPDRWLLVKCGEEHFWGHLEQEAPLPQLQGYLLTNAGKELATGLRAPPATGLADALSDRLGIPVGLDPPEINHDALEIGHARTFSVRRQTWES